MAKEELNVYAIADPEWSPFLWIPVKNLKQGHLAICGTLSLNLFELLKTEGVSPVLIKSSRGLIRLSVLRDSVTETYDRNRTMCQHFGTIQTSNCSLQNKAGWVIPFSEMPTEKAFEEGYEQVVIRATMLPRLPVRAFEKPVWA